MTNGKIILVGVVILLVSGLSGADSISSIIGVNGASFVSSSVISQGQTYAESLFTTDIASLMRSLNIGSDGSLVTMTNAKSSGPLGVYEYSGQGTNSSENSDNCIFTLPESITFSQNEINYLGLMQTGQYVSTRNLDPSLTRAVTMVNGSGMMIVRAKSVDGTNETTHSGDVAGEMNMTETIIFGDEK